jgi:amino acid transporter
MFRGLGAWRERGSTPANALLVQGVITLLLVAAGAATPDGFNAMVAYTSPVFWTFFLLTGLTLFVFRKKERNAPGFRVPLYPVVPAAFCLMCLYMLYSSINYVRNPDYGPKFGFAVLAGLVVMAAAIPLYFLAKKSR